MTFHLPVRRLRWLVSLFLLATWGGSAPLAAQTAAPADPATEYSRLLRRYCVGCHNDRTLTAGVTLQNLDLARIGENTHETEIWEKVIRKLSTRLMPPADRPRPDEATYDELTAWTHPLSRHFSGEIECD